MYPVSDGFLAAAVAGDQIAPTLVTVTDVTTGQVTTLDVVTSGSVTIDRTRDVRRTCRLTLVDETGTLTPAAATDLLAPFGNEIRLWRGLRVVGVDELVPLGVFRLTGMQVTDGAGGVEIELDGSDRSIVVQRARWTDLWVTDTTSTLEDEVAAILTDRYPAVVTSFPVTGLMAPRVTLDVQGDPWQDCRELFRSAGYELHFDADGVAVASQPATIDGSPVATYADGAQAVLLDLSRQVSTAASVYNGVIAIGESTANAAPVRGEAWDDDPSSPTYRYGPFGQVPLFYRSPMLTTAAQAAQAARTRLNGLAGASEQIAWSQIVNPAHDAGDVVQITRTRAGLDAVRVVLDAVTIPLHPSEAMSASGRRPFL